MKPNTESDDYGNPETLLAELNTTEAKIASACDRLKEALSKALLRSYRVRVLSPTGKTDHARGHF